MRAVDHPHYDSLKGTPPTKASMDACLAADRAASWDSFRLVEQVPATHCEHDHCEKPVEFWLHHAGERGGVIWRGNRKRGFCADHKGDVDTMNREEALRRIHNDRYDRLVRADQSGDPSAYHRAMNTSKAIPRDAVLA